MKYATEAALAADARTWLLADGWDVYSEVAPWGGGARRADLVGTRGAAICIVETKLQLSWELLEQCMAWTGYVNFVWAAVPHAKSARDTKYQVYGRFGIGVAELERGSWGRGVDVRVDMRAEPAFQRRTNGRVEKSLHPYQRVTDAGTNRGGYSTPFSRTCEALRREVSRCGGEVKASQAIKALTHHYVSNSSARSGLIGAVRRGIVPGLSIHGHGRDLVFREAKR